MRLSILSFLLVFCLQSIAQETPIAKINYVFKHMNDTTQRDKFTRDEVSTFLGKHSSYYTSVSNEKFNASLKEKMSSPSFDGNIIFNRNFTPAKSAYVLDIDKKNLQHIFRIVSDEYLLEDTYPEMEWDIQDETKEIGGYNCQKAITTFKGRTYEVWFASELPFPFGPWKLHGLTGLILAANDIKNEVIFEFDGFELIEGETTQRIEPSAKAVKASLTEVEKLDKLYAENPNGYIQSRGGNSGRVVAGNSGSAGAFTIKSSSPASVTNSSGSSSLASIKSISIKNDENYNPSKNTNNPIELIP